MAGVVVLYHHYRPYGRQPYDRFCAAYERHAAGVEHELKLVVRHLPGGSDLGDYRLALDETDAELVCFLNCHSEPLCDGWLSRLVDAVDDGIAGATGSYEGAIPPPLWEVPALPFPNPHVRSTGFIMRRDLALGLAWPSNLDKPQAWMLECGPNSLTRQVDRLGRATLVVGIDGVYGTQHWGDSRTYRVDEQENLLIGDNRTRDYASAIPERRKWLAELAWGCWTPWGSSTPRS